MNDSGGHTKCISLPILPGPWDLEGSVDAVYSGVETDTGPCSELPAEEVCCPFLVK